jgi:hypothetical protein
MMDAAQNLNTELESFVHQHSAKKVPKGPKSPPKPKKQSQRHLERTIRIREMKADHAMKLKNLRKELKRARLGN